MTDIEITIEAPPTITIDVIASGPPGTADLTGYLQPVDVLAGAGIEVTRTAETATIAIVPTPLRMVPTPWAALSTTGNLTVASPAAVYPVPLVNQIELHGVVHSPVTNPERVYVTESGIYEVSLSAQMDLTVSPVDQQVELWMRVNNVDIVDSNLITLIGDLNMITTASIKYLLALNAGDYVSFHYRGSNTNCRLLAQAAGANPARPSAPAAVLTLIMHPSMILLPEV